MRRDNAPRGALFKPSGKLGCNVAEWGGLGGRVELSSQACGWMLGWTGGWDARAWVVVGRGGEGEGGGDKEGCLVETKMDMEGCLVVGRISTHKVLVSRTGERGEAVEMRAATVSIAG